MCGGLRAVSRAVVDALWESDDFSSLRPTQPRVHGSPNTATANWDAEQSMFEGSALAAFNGSGVLVGVADTGVDLTHCRHQYGNTAASCSRHRRRRDRLRAGAALPVDRLPDSTAMGRTWPEGSSMAPEARIRSTRTPVPSVMMVFGR